MRIDVSILLQSCLRCQGDEKVRLRGFASGNFCAYHATMQACPVLFPTSQQTFRCSSLARAAFSFMGHG